MCGGDIITRKEREMSIIVNVVDVEKNKLKLADGTTVSILKIEPINFKLKSKAEQLIILDSYKYFFKLCDFDMQVLIQTQKADTKKHVEEVRKCILYEPQIGDLAEDYMKLIDDITDVRGSISRKFFIILKTKSESEEVETAKIIEGLRGCGNNVVQCSEEETLNVLRSGYKI